MSQTLKEGSIYTYNLPQHTANYQVRISPTPKGLWLCILQSFTQWKLTITQELMQEVVAKASAGKQTFSYKEFINAIGSGLSKEDQKWGIGIMTPIELARLRGGLNSRQKSSSKIYMILSDKQKKFHYPFTLSINDVGQKQKYSEAIKKMKLQLNSLRSGEKSQNSLLMMSESNMMEEEVRVENEELKKRIKIYEESLTQKRGAVEIDQILKQKNSLEIQAETKKRQQNRQLNRLKNVFALLQRENKEIQSEIQIIFRELSLLEDNLTNPAKIKSHALRVLKAYETELRTSKKIILKQGKEIETLKRNIQNSKNIQKRNIAKIQQIQNEIDQSKKKANIKQISNRLHSNSGGSRQGSSVASSNKAPSVVSQSSGGTRSVGYNRIPKSNNLVRQNLLKKTSDIRNDRSVSGSNSKNNLLKTTTNMKTAVDQRKTQYKPPVRPVVSSHQVGKTNSQKKLPYTKNSGSTTIPMKSASSELKKTQFSSAEKERQEKAMERLTGGYKKAIDRKIGVSDKGRVYGDVRKVEERKNTKDILKRMKDVKAEYNARSRKSVEKNKDVAVKVAEMRKKNQ